MRNGWELWMNNKYLGMFTRVEDMLEKVWKLGEPVEPDPQLRLEWD